MVMGQLDIHTQKNNLRAILHVIYTSEQKLDYRFNAMTKLPDKNIEEKCLCPAMVA